MSGFLCGFNQSPVGFSLNPFQMLEDCMQSSPLNSLSVPALVLLDRYQVSFLFWRLSLLSPLVAKPHTPLASSLPRLHLAEDWEELNGVTGSSFSPLSTLPTKVTSKLKRTHCREGRCWIWAGPSRRQLGLWPMLPQHPKLPLSEPSIPL